MLRATGMRAALLFIAALAGTQAFHAQSALVSGGAGVVTTRFGDSTFLQPIVAPVGLLTLGEHVLIESRFDFREFVARDASGELAKFQKWNPIISNRASFDPKLSDDMNRMMNMLKSGDVDGVPSLELRALDTSDGSLVTVDINPGVSWGTAADYGGCLVIGED